MGLLVTALLVLVVAGLLLFMLGDPSRGHRPRASGTPLDRPAPPPGPGSTSRVRQEITITMADTQRIEDRTPNTAGCPDTEHEHRWRRRRPELTLGTDRFMTYVADRRGLVEVTEEALAQVLRLAGFTPDDGERR